MSSRDYPSNAFLKTLWIALAAQDFVDVTYPVRHELRMHTPDRPYTKFDRKRSMTALVDPDAVLDMYDEMLRRIRQRDEWDELDDDQAVVEEVLAKLEEALLSAYAGVTVVEFFNGYFRPHSDSPPRPERR